jgi:hypothetical protein
MTDDTDTRAVRTDGAADAQDAMRALFHLAAPQSNDGQLIEHDRLFSAVSHLGRRLNASRRRSTSQAQVQNRESARIDPK